MRSLSSSKITTQDVLILLQADEENAEGYLLFEPKSFQIGV